MVFVISGCVLAAIAQILLKRGASGAALADYANGWIAAGLSLYVVGPALWIVALSKSPLSTIYPFTILTFAIVYLASFLMLGELIASPIIVGIGPVLAGLILVTTA